MREVFCSQLPSWLWPSPTLLCNSALSCSFMMPSRLGSSTPLRSCLMMTTYIRPTKNKAQGLVHAKKCCSCTQIYSTKGNCWVLHSCIGWFDVVLCHSTRFFNWMIVRKTFAHVCCANMHYVWCMRTILYWLEMPCAGVGCQKKTQGGLCFSLIIWA